MISYSGFKSALVYMSNYTKMSRFLIFYINKQDRKHPYRSIKLYNNTNSTMQKNKTTFKHINAEVMMKKNEEYSGNVGGEFQKMDNM